MRPTGKPCGDFSGGPERTNAITVSAASALHWTYWGRAVSCLSSCSFPFRLEFRSNPSSRNQPMRSGLQGCGFSQCSATASFGIAVLAFRFGSFLLLALWRLPCVSRLRLRSDWLLPIYAFFPVCQGFFRVFLRQAGWHWRGERLTLANKCHESGFMVLPPGGTVLDWYDHFYPDI